MHAKDQFLDLSGRMGYKLYVGERFESQVTVQDILQLEYKQVKNALALTSSDKRCSHEIYDDCMYEAVASFMKKNSEDKCTVPWIRDNRNICSNPKDINTTFWIAWNRITNQEKDCMVPCHTTLVNVGAKNYQKFENRTYSQMYFYFPSRVAKSEEHYLYTTLKLIAQVGGYLGLYRIALWLLELCKFNRLRKEGNVKTEDVNEPASAPKDELMTLSALALVSI